MAIEFPVGLGARSVHRRALAAVQHAELDTGPIDGPGHQPVQGVDLSNQMSLAQAADGGIAGHFTDGGFAMGDQQGARAAPRRRGRGFAAGVPAAHDDDIEPLHGGAIY